MVSTAPIPATDAADTSSNTLTSQRENIATVGVEGSRKLSADYDDYKARRESERELKSDSACVDRVLRRCC